MGFHTFANGELLTAQKVNDYLMRQAVIVCADATAQGLITSPNDGMLIYREDLDAFLGRINGAWTRIAPTPHAVFTRSTDFTLSASLQAVPFIAPTIAVGWTWASGTPTRMVCAVAGQYLIAADGLWQINSTGNGVAQPFITGNAFGEAQSRPNASGAAVMSPSWIGDFGVGDYLEIKAQSSGAFPWIASNKVAISLLNYR